MAAVTYTDGTIREYYSGESKIVVWLSPSTMDANDTVAPTAITGKTIYVLSCINTTTTGDAVTATNSAGTITIDTAGGTTTDVYVLTFTYI
jgi:hypothetical protein